MKAADVDILHAGKALFRKYKMTKGVFSEYDEKVKDCILPCVKGRPLTLRFRPDGIGEEGFFNQNPLDHFPDFIRRIRVRERGKGKKTVTMPGADKTVDLVYFVRQTAIEVQAALPHADQPRTEWRTPHDVLGKARTHGRTRGCDHELGSEQICYEK